MCAVLVSNIVERNGKTVRENNLTVNHSIPLRTLVEVKTGGGGEDHYGIRMFVCGHPRDCDGTPLYELYSSDDFTSLDYFTRHNLPLRRIMTVDGFSENSLTIIRPPREK